MTQRLPASIHPPSDQSLLRRAHIAELFLLLACVFWGASFTWAKIAGRQMNELTGAGPGATIGPLWILSLRFVGASTLWFAVCPAARRGWNRASIGYGTVLGLLLSAGMILQHLGLDRSTPAITAFLTSLVVVFVPVLSWLILRHPPRAITWIGVGVATVGIWLMTAATASGFGLGEWYALACAVAWAMYIVALGRIGLKDDPARLVGAQFIVTAIVTLAWSLLVSPDGISTLLRLSLDRQIVINTGLLCVFATLIAYAILTYQQPRIDATRAALIYLAEPIFGAIFAWILLNSAMTLPQIIGALLILVANLIVEMLAGREALPKPE
jgi:drug/metabolite transporter (DMT)-like permease